MIPSSITPNLETVAMPMTILGIDPDTKNLHVVESGSNSPQSSFYTHTIPMPSAVHKERCGFAFRGLGELLFNLTERDGKPPLIYLEEPVQGPGGPGGTIPQVYIHGAVMTAADEYNCKLVQVNNKTWKKRECGNGNIKKEDIPSVLEEKWPELYKVVHGQQDLVDAGFIYLFGRHHYNLVTRLKKKAGK